MSGERPDAGERVVVIDRVDFADLDSEAAHDVRIVPSAPGFIGSNRIARRRSRDGAPLVDAGRGLAGTVSFTVRDLVPGRDVLLRLRYLPVPGGESIRMAVGGLPPVDVAFGGAREGSFAEEAFVIDGGVIGSSTLRLSLEGRMMLFHAWIVAGEGAPGEEPERRIE